ncbi:ChbG/HpnK family deacetylase [Polycladidibacter stylochi]|uniref:ChbG/HpnK family deacetylase n=1 Tax=Polycladidibacter stylochi TaxID=1807766 RepID=UPI00082B485A|nr:ChbG/HpnK family deacetylase [Pseudovibrio stylochi]
MLYIADDYAYTPEATAGILDLMRAGKVHGTSCMTASPYWPVHAHALKNLCEENKGLQAGLHITLSGSWFGALESSLWKGGFPTMERLLLTSLARQLDSTEIATEVRAQLEAFVSVFGRLPDYVDGHQHCHVFPQIRSVVLTELHKAQFTGWVRHCGGPIRNILQRPFKVKALILNHLSNAMLRINREAFATNKDFCGLYDFAPSSDFEGLLQTWTRFEDDACILMCHPGHDLQTGTPRKYRDSDSIASARSREFAQLKA